MTSQNVLKDLILQAREMNSFEIFLAPEATARARRKNEWVPMTKSALSAAETRGIFLSLLSEEQREQLLDQGRFEGVWLGISGQKFFCQVQITTQGLSGSLAWVPEELTKRDFWGFPKWTETSLARGQGVHVLTARNRWHLEAAAASLVQAVNETQQKIIYWQKREALTVSPSQSSVVIYGAEGHVPESCDLLVCEGLESLSLALNQSARGRSVLLLIQSQSTTEALAQMTELNSTSRWAQSFQWALGARIIEGVQGWVPVFDLIAGSESVRQLIKSKQIGEIDGLMEQEQSSGFDGVRTMNQALLQMMLKRKIDLRQGFEESPAPEKLDQLLKKVGL
jgi:Tfp pilus assembly pilus retraction ATPase PilT